MLPGAQQHTTVKSAAALRIQDKTKGKYDENIYSVNGQYNVSDDSNTDLHSYLDLASSNIIAHRM